jgi:hypothetical protein
MSARLVQDQRAAQQAFVGRFTCLSAQGLPMCVLSMVEHTSEQVRLVVRYSNLFLLLVEHKDGLLNIFCISMTREERSTGLYSHQEVGHYDIAQVYYP